ncbi:MAG: serine hydrolase domain-containing protein [Candidatus Limnocylindrales bacterium]
MRDPGQHHSTRHRDPRQAAAQMIRLLRAMAIALLLVAGTLAVAPPAQAASSVPVSHAPAVTDAALQAPSATVRSVATSPPHFTRAITTRLATTLAQLRSVNHLPGLEAVIRYPDGAAWLGHAGFGDIAAHQAMGNLTLLDAGSITKTFVAALVLQLAGRGVLGLDDPIARWLPGLPYDTGITIRELLDHTSGVDDAFNHAALLAALDANHRRAWTAPQVLAYVGKAHFPPGQGWSYSNSNYILLGQIIERATGNTLAALLRQHFFVPLHLTHTYLQSEEPISGTVAHGYEFTSPTGGSVKDLSDGTPHLPFTSLESSLGAAGALVTTADDLARWALYLYRGRVLPPGQLSQMLDFGLTAAFHPVLPYGLGVERRSFEGRGSWGHDGSLSGFRSAMRYFPASGGVTIVVMTNSDRVLPDTLVGSLLDVLYPPSA